MERKVLCAHLKLSSLFEHYRKVDGRMPTLLSSTMEESGHQLLKYSESRLMQSLVNVISPLMYLNLNEPFNGYLKITSYCHHLVNVITFGLA